MKNSLFVFGCVAGLVVCAADMEYTSYFFTDDFERNVKRDGNPKLVSGMTAPGLLSQTRMGYYTGTSVAVLSERWGLSLRRVFGRMGNRSRLQLKESHPARLSGVH